MPDFFWTILVGRLSGNAWVLRNRRAALLMSGDSCGANASFGRDAFRSRGLLDDRCGIQSVTVSAIVLESVCNPSQEVPNWQLTERLILLFFHNGRERYWRAKQLRSAMFRYSYATIHVLPAYGSRIALPVTEKPPDGEPRWSRSWSLVSPSLVDQVPQRLPFPQPSEVVEEEVDDLEPNVLRSPAEMRCHQQAGYIP